MLGKKTSQNRVETAVLMGPMDANPYGNVHGGVIMRNIDEAAAIAAIRHSRRNTVTASIDRLNFLKPVFVGEVVIFKSNVNMAFRTSMEVGVRVEAENLYTGNVRHVASAYLTFVCIDEDHHPVALPPLIPECEEDERRMREAGERRSERLKGRSCAE